MSGRVVTHVWSVTMCVFSPRNIALASATIVLSLALAAAAAAQEGASMPVRDITRLGGTTALRRPPLTTVASLMAMGSSPRSAADIRTVLGQAGLPALADKVIATMAAANTAVVGGLCSDAAPADGAIVECDVQKGQTLQWMAYRPKGGTTLGLLQNIRWAGQKPFRAFVFRVTDDTRVYTFVVPKVCGNLSLMNMVDTPRAVVAVAPPPVVPAPPPMVAVIEVPPPAAAPFFEAALPAVQAAPAAVAHALPFFVDALVGKDRRVRPIDGTALAYAQCSPLLGLKFGMSKRFQNDWEVAGAVGIAISLVRADDKVNEHELFADVEVNKYLSGGAFLGTGLSLWDLTRSDTFTPAWMIHFGLPLAPHAKFPVYLLTEGRLFLDNADDIRNNYQFWGGVRVRF